MRIKSIIISPQHQIKHSQISNTTISIIKIHSTTYRSCISCSFFSSKRHGTTKVMQSSRRQAKRAVQRIYDGDCNNALDRDFTRKVNRMRDRKFPRNARNWKDRQYNNCGRDAIKTELNRIGRQCRNSGQAAKDCNELGKVAAGNIVDRSNVCPAEDEASGPFGASHHNLQKFRRHCRSVAYGQCKGYITNAVRQCGGDRLSLRKQSRLQDECEEEVDSMTGYDNSEGLDFMTNNAQFFNDETSEDISSGDEYGSSGSDSADYYDTW